MVEIDEKIFQALKESEKPSLNIDALAPLCGVQRKDFDEFEKLIYALIDQGLLVKKGSRRVSMAVEGDYVEGRYKARRNGDGIVIPDEENASEIYVAGNSSRGAFLNDKVRVRVKKTKPGRGGRSGDYEYRGKVVKILERGFVEIVGEYVPTPNGGVCRPDDPRFPDYIVIASQKAKLDPAKGDKVVVHLEYYGERGDAPSGKLVTVLGPADAKGVDIAGIIVQYNLAQKFPPSVVKEAKALPEVLQEADYKGRKDCRKHTVITIDPDDARDFDDAIYVKLEKDGSYRVWVHIADVSHFVKPGSRLDKEAESRGNSTYLVDRVIPMLPESLSNGLCSLQPRVDRLTKCAEILIDPSGIILQYELYPAVIHSKMRYTYQEAMEVIDGGGKNTPTDKVISLGWEIASRCRERRIHGGSLDLDFPDRKIRLNKDGEISDIDIMENDQSHQLIEEFMLLANECVAREIRERKTKSIFRIHEDPARERLRELEEILNKNRISVKGLHRPGQINRAVQRIKSHPAASALSISVLRSMKRARYSTKPVGHFGLSKKDYTHFTSPIRRYADLIVHRSVFEKDSVNTDDLTRIADHISWTERNSADAETDSRMVKLMKYLIRVKNDRTRGTLQALVIDVRAKGLWVDIPALGISGVVPTRALGTDSYKFSPSGSFIQGRKSGRKFKLGDRLSVRVLKIDKEKRMLDFKLDEGPNTRSASKRSEHQSRHHFSAKKVTKKSSQKHRTSYKKATDKHSDTMSTSQNKAKKSRPRKRK